MDRAGFLTRMGLGALAGLFARRVQAEEPVDGPELYGHITADSYLGSRVAAIYVDGVEVKDVTEVYPEQGWAKHYVLRDGTYPGGEIPVAIKRGKITLEWKP